MTLETDSQEQADSLSGQQKQTIIQWQELANSIASTYLLHGQIRENELLLFLHLKSSELIFPWSAQARQFIFDTDQQRRLSKKKQEEINRRIAKFPIWSDLPTREAYKFEFKKSDVITEIVASFSADEAERPQRQTELPLTSPTQFVTYEFNSPYFKDRVATKGSFQISDTIEYLRKKFFGPFRFDQIVSMTRLFIQDLQSILLAAPKTKDYLPLYRGLKNSHIVPLGQSSRKVPTFQAFSTVKNLAQNYIEETCCLERVLLPVGSRAFKIPQSLLRFPRAMNDEEVILPKDTTQIRLMTPNPAGVNDTQSAILP